jgi:peptidoglycan/LPS O-acetylase OafA/YrhL
VTTLVDLPGLAVAGFFGISGFLITRSARRSSLPRYLWHRALRILPGLWGCLLVTGFVLAPWLWYLKHGNLHGLWRTPGGVLDYLRNNWLAESKQYGILDLLTDTPYGQLGPSSVFNGSLWTLAYELACYLMVAVLAALLILRNARLMVLLMGVVVFGVLVWNEIGHAAVWTDGYVKPIPMYVPLLKVWLLRYGFMFLMGAVAELYSDRLPINDLLGVASLAVVVWFAFHGDLFGPALLGYEYVVLWLAVRLPRFLHRVGRTNDYSYGVYIYTFPVQQVMAKFGAPALGFWGFLAVTAVGGFACAYASWHLIEKQALRWKDWTPRPLRERAEADEAGAPPPERAALPGQPRPDVDSTPVPEPAGR